MTARASAPQVSCPKCGKKSVWDAANPFRPFCCERCKMIDLGQWASEEYRVELPETAAADFSEPPYQA